MLVFDVCSCKTVPTWPLLQELKEKLNQMEADLAGERNTMALGYKVKQGLTRPTVTYYRKHCLLVKQQ
jgi:hypothetical protein